MFGGYGNLVQGRELGAGKRLREAGTQGPSLGGGGGRCCRINLPVGFEANLPVILKFWVFVLRATGRRGKAQGGCLSCKIRLWFPAWSMNWSGESWQGCVWRVGSSGNTREEGGIHLKGNGGDRALGRSGKGEKDQNWSSLSHFSNLLEVFFFFFYFHWDREDH